MSDFCVECGAYLGAETVRCPECGYDPSVLEELDESEADTIREALEKDPELVEALKEKLTE